MGELYPERRRRHGVAAVGHLAVPPGGGATPPRGRHQTHPRVPGHRGHQALHARPQPGGLPADRIPWKKPEPLSGEVVLLGSLAVTPISFTASSSPTLMSSRPIIVF